MNKRLVYVALYLCLQIFSFHFAQASTTYYIDFASGSDSNNGTSKITAWKHHPYMQGWTGSYTHTAGDDFIFKGGVTWDYTNFEMSIGASGASPSNPDYYGVDLTWYDSGTCGVSFCRPIFDGGHRALASGSNIVSVSSKDYITIDNIEIKGHRAYTNWGVGSISHYCSTYLVMQNLYVHDWQLDVSVTTDDAHGGIIGNYPSCRPTGTRISTSTISNTEAKDAGRQNGIAVRNTDVEYSTIFDVQTAQLFGLMHDSVVYNVSYPATGRGVVGSNQGFDTTPYHENVTYVEGWDGFNLPAVRPAMIYNNRFYNIQAGSGAIYPNGCPATPFYIFNNLVYNNYANMAVQIEQYGGSGTCGEYHIWNNTFESPSSNVQPLIHQVNRGFPISILDTKNNHYIHDSGSYVNITSSVATRLDSNNVGMTNAQATTNSYTAGNLYQPTAGNSSTVGVGANLTSEGFASLNKDKLLVSRPSSGAWDAGAYQYVDPTIKAITTFDLNGLSPAVVGVISEANKTVTLTVPYGTNLTGLVPTIVITGASISPASLEAHTFVDGVASNYTVTAADSSTQVYQVTVNVSAESTSPTPGNSGTITTASVTSSSLTLNWTKATDNVSSQGSLQYRVYRSSSNNIDSVANIEANGTAQNAYTSDIATLNISGLSAATTYYFNIIVKDEAGNKAAYTTKSQLTLQSDLSAPTVDTYTPTDNATAISTSTNLTLVFNENVAKGTGNILIKKTLDDTTVQTIDVNSASVSISSATVTINPTDLDYNTGYYVTMASGVIVDTAIPTPNAYAGISVKTTWNFTTAPSTLNRIETFTISNQSDSTVINHFSQTVALTMPFETNPASLTPTITLSTNATVSPLSGVARDFTNPVTYTVTAQDGVTTQAYTVTVTIASSPTPSPTPTPTPTPTPSSGGSSSGGGGGGGGGGYIYPPALLANQSIATSTCKTLIYQTLNKNLSQGNTGSDVTLLQQILILEKFLTAGSATGVYNLITTQAVTKFQLKYGVVLTSTPETPGIGVVGPKTRTTINKFISQAKYPSLAQCLNTTTSIVSQVVIQNKYVFTRTLKLGSTGPDVKALQVLLNNLGFVIATSGAGSKGQETTYFGQATQKALIKFQEAYVKDVLVPSGLTRGTGFFGTSTIKKANQLSAGN